jgi:hypothetical protein
LKQEVSELGTALDKVRWTFSGCCFLP